MALSHFESLGHAEGKNAPAVYLTAYQRVHNLLTMQRILLILSLLLFAGLTHSASAFLWFGDDDEWKTMEPAEQDERAYPYYEIAQEAQDAGRLKKALSHYRRVWKNYPGSSFAPDALYQTGEIEMERKEWKDASEAFQRLLQFYPETRRFNEVIANLFDIATAYQEGENVYFLFVIPSRATEQAIATYETIVRRAPYSDYAPLALIRIALLYRQRDEIPEAIDALDRLINNYPQNMLASDAYLKLAETFADLVEGPPYDQGATREAVSYFQDYMVLFPNNPAVGDAEEGLEDMLEVYAQSRLIMGEFYYHRRDNYTAAEVFFNEAITIAPDSVAAEEAREYLQVVDGINRAYPEGNYPRRNVWQHLAPWGGFDPAEDIPGVSLDPDQPALTTPEPMEEPLGEAEEVGGIGGADDITE